MGQIKNIKLHIVTDIKITDKIRRMDGFMSLPDGVTKRVMHAGKGEIPNFANDSKVLFHYRALYEKEGKEIVLDDSRKQKEPFELILGKKFKLEIWEDLLKTMRLSEVAAFICHPKHVSTYPMVSKSLRDIQKKKHCHGKDHDHDHEGGHVGHQCGYSALANGLGYPDLDEFMKEPAPLTFQIELLQHTAPGEYKPETWTMSLEQKLEKLPQWKEEGNVFYKRQEYDEACKIYGQAIGALEQLMTREKPGTDEHVKLDKMKIPFLLNYAQCLLSKKDYYQAIPHLTEVLEKDADNVKALYRRAKAYQSVYEFNSARTDYGRVKDLDSSLAKTVVKEMESIDREERQKNLEDKERFKNVFK